MKFQEKKITAGIHKIEIHIGMYPSVPLRRPWKNVLVTTFIVCQV